MDPGVEPDEAAQIPQFDELGPEMAQGDPATLSLVYDLSLPVAIELGRTRMSVQEVLALGRGSVIQLERLAGEPIDVFVGDRRFAEGEVVVVGEQFGVRITRVITPPAKDSGEAN
jgi:flagellar motor switch protein FliN/FliY